MRNAPGSPAPPIPRLIATEIAEIRATFKVVGGPEIWDAVRRRTPRLVDSPR
ncbi:MAG TPA: hypothetical protein VFZ37_21970 [Jiangellaceae bacterium]